MELKSIFNNLFDFSKNDNHIHFTSVILKYKDTKDNYKGLIILLVLCFGLSYLTYILKLHDSLFLFCALSLLVGYKFYIYKSRHCEKCKNKMKRMEQNDDSIYYYCDTCQTKIKLLMGSGQNTA